MPKRPVNIKRPWVQERKPFGRDRDFSKFYNARKWRNTAKAHKLKHPFCVDCEKEGIVAAVKVTDHVRGLGFLMDNGLDPYDYNELQSLCEKHHNIKSGKESHRNRGMG